jgi:hypothetical protein
MQVRAVYGIARSGRDRLQGVSREDHTVNSGAHQLVVRLTWGLPLGLKSRRSPVRPAPRHPEVFTFQWGIVHVRVPVIFPSASNACVAPWSRRVAGVARSGWPSGLVPREARPLVRPGQIAAPVSPTGSGLRVPGEDRQRPHPTAGPYRPG